ncbi:hypothetical protein ACIO1C_03860 [Streptomyces sp. NPDC087420]
MRTPGVRVGGERGQMPRRQVAVKGQFGAHARAGIGGELGVRRGGER